MIINNVNSSKTFYDYDFRFTDSTMLALSIEPDLGDTITWGDDKVNIVQVERKDPLSDKVASLEEHTTLFTRHIMGVSSRVRVVEQANPEERAALQKTILEVASGRR